MDDLQPDDPTRIGPFRLVARLGAGGMGQVYLGRDIRGRQAAVKVVHPGHAADPEFRDRFAREIATARSVDSPWTAAVVAADPHAPQPWLATEYVAGPDLAAAVAASGPLPEDAATALASRLAQALAHLHAAGVVHRDLKPSNVLLSADGPRLIDFGIARAVDDTRITRTGVVVGTPAFMSPEQALGQESGPPSDVFSLAAVITFAATGTGPFGRSTGNPVVMLRKVSAGEPDLGAVPAGLREAIAPCLAKDPAARPSAEQLASRLAELDPGTAREWLPTVVGLPTPATPQPSAGTGWPQWRTVAVAAALGVVAAAALIGFLLAGGPGPAEEPAPPPAAAAPTSPPPAQQTPRTFGAAAAAPPPAATPAGLVPSRVPGWLAAVSTTRNAAYDVPPPWAASSPGHVMGYEAEDGTKIVMSGVALHELTDRPACHMRDSYLLAWSGVAGADTPDPVVAARSVAELWTGFYKAENGARPRATYSSPRPVTVDGQGGSHVVADVAVPAGSCAAPRAAVHAVAVPDGKGQSIVWVLLTERDVPGALSDEQIDQVIGTLRPAGLQQKCDPTRRVVGSWC